MQTRVMWAAVTAVGVLALLAGVDLASSAGRIHPGVTVGGVRVGGMKPARAMTALRVQLSEKSKPPVVISYRSKMWTIEPEDLGLTFDYAMLTMRAMKVGRSGGLLDLVKQRTGAWFGSAVLPARADCEKEKLEGVLADIAQAVDVPPTDAKVVLDGTTARVKHAKSGMLVGRGQLTTELLAAFTSSKREIEVPVNVAEAAIGDAAADEARAVVETMLAEPAKITWGKKAWTLSARELAKMISFRKLAGTRGADWLLEPYVSEEEASDVIAPKLGNRIGRPARDATFRTRAGRVTIVPSKTGVGPDIGALAADLTSTLKGVPGMDRVIEIRTHKTQAKISTAMAREMNIHERISTFRTSYSSGMTSRVNNIHLLGDSLDGELIAPGATFSFNRAVGERTAAKGYQEANAIVDGKLVPQLGGGICQVGTTLFNTAFLAGVPVIERHNHSFYISHYPKGRDATVSWGGPDLKFKNDTGNWLLLSVAYSSSSITMSLYGTDPGYTVTSKTSGWSNLRKFSREKTKDPKLAKGTEVIEEAGLTGRTCTVTRTVKKDGEVVREDTFKSVYRPKIEIVRVGTKSKPSKDATDKAGSGD